MNIIIIITLLICVEVDLHNVVTCHASLSNFHLYPSLDSLLKNVSISICAVELISSNHAAKS